MTDEARVQAQDNVLSSPMAAALLLKLKEECEAQHARAEAAEARAASMATALQMVATLEPLRWHPTFDESLARQLQEIAKSALAAVSASAREEL